MNLPGWFWSQAECANGWVANRHRACSRNNFSRNLKSHSREKTLLFTLLICKQPPRKKNRLKFTSRCDCWVTTLDSSLGEYGGTCGPGMGWAERGALVGERAMPWWNDPWAWCQCPGFNAQLLHLPFFREVLWSLGSSASSPLNPLMQN